MAASLRAISRRAYGFSRATDIRGPLIAYLVGETGGERADESSVA
jgi:hypothetical protein